MVHTAKSLVSTLILFSSIVLLSACGGGSDSPAPDTTPNAYSFTSQTDVSVGSMIESPAVTIAGIDEPVAVSISGGEYSIDGGSYTSAAGTISSGQTLSVRLAASEQFGTPAELTVTVGGVSATFTATTIAEDLSPETFDFSNVTSAMLDTVYTSGSVTVTGINSSAPISVVGGEYSINSGAFTSADGEIMNGQSLAVRLTSSSAFATESQLTVTIGGVSAAYSVTTVAEDLSPETFSFTSVTSAALDTVVTSNTVTVDGINSSAVVSIEGGEYSIDGGAFTSADGIITNGQELAVQLTSSTVFATQAQLTVDVGDASQTFSVTTVAQDISPDAFSFTPDNPVVVRSASVESDAVTVEGITGSVGVSISGGEYAVNGGSYTSDAGFIENGQSVQVRLTASSSFDTPVTVTLTIGDTNVGFTATTEVRDISPDTFSFDDQDDALFDTVYPAVSAITVAGINDAASISINNGFEYAIGETVEGGDYTSEASTVSNGDVVWVRGTSANTVSTSVTGDLTIGDVTGSFTITTFADEDNPTAEIAFPPPISMTRSSSVLVRGTAQDQYSDITSVTVNGVEATSDDGFATWRARIEDLSAGENTITIEVVDSAETPNTNENAATVTVVFDSSNENFPNDAISIANARAISVDHTRGDILLGDSNRDAIIRIDMETGLRSVLSDNSTPGGEGTFSNIEGILVNLSDDSIWVADHVADAVFEVDLATGERTVLAQDGDPDNIDFNNPREMIVSPYDPNLLLVADQGGNVKSMHVDTGARVQLGINSSEGIKGITYDSVADRILLINDIFSENGVVVLGEIGQANTHFSTNQTHPGTESVQWDEPRSIAINFDDYIAYVADLNLAAVGIVDLATADSRILSDSTTPDAVNPFIEPKELFFDGSFGYILVTDIGQDAVIAVDIETGERVFVSKGSDV